MDKQLTQLVFIFFEQGNLNLLLPKFAIKFSIRHCLGIDEKRQYFLPLKLFLISKVYTLYSKNQCYFIRN